MGSYYLMNRPYIVEHLMSGDLTNCGLEADIVTTWSGHPELLRFCVPLYIHEGILYLTIGEDSSHWSMSRLTLIIKRIDYQTS